MCGAVLAGTSNEATRLPIAPETNVNAAMTVVGARTGNASPARGPVAMRRSPPTPLATAVTLATGPSRLTRAAT